MSEQPLCGPLNWPTMRTTAEADRVSAAEAEGHCYACMVGVATGPESHSPGCVARDIPMPEQDGQWRPGSDWDWYRHRVAKAKNDAWDAFVRTAETITCTCRPCETPAYGVPGRDHCAACCYGSLIEEYDPRCPDVEHRAMARRQFPTDDAVTAGAPVGFDDEPPF